MHYRCQAIAPVSFLFLSKHHQGWLVDFQTRWSLFVGATPRPRVLGLSISLMPHSPAFQAYSFIPPLASQNLVASALYLCT